MDSFFVNLSSSTDKIKRFRRFVILLSLFLVVLAILPVVFLSFFFGFNVWLSLFLGLHTVIYGCLVYSSYKSELYVKADKVGLVFKVSLYRQAPVRIFWESVKMVKLGPAYVAFYKASGRRRMLRLGLFSYRNVILVKRNIEAIAKELDIPIVYGAIINYSDIDQDEISS